MLRGLLRPLEQRESFSALQCAFVVGKNYRLQDIQLSKSESGGEYRARTGDLLVANQALSQLS
jgi:hypothetical protein